MRTSGICAILLASKQARRDLFIRLYRIVVDAAVTLGLLPLAAVLKFDRFYGDDQQRRRLFSGFCLLLETFDLGQSDRQPLAVGRIEIHGYTALIHDFIDFTLA